jgi:restriction system protein
MAIPDYQTIMLPLLKHLGDGQERSTQETFDALADELALSEEERKELLSSGRQPVFTNRIGWAKVYLKKALLIEAPKRAHYKITERGLEVLQQNPAAIDNNFLMQFPEFEEFIKTRAKPKPGGEGPGVVEPPDTGKTPEDYLEYGYARVRQELAVELLKTVKECTPYFFEGLVLDVLLGMGYGGSRQDAAKTVGRGSDGGIDGIIKEDRLGLDRVYIQAKRWEGTVGRPEIQKFAGALQGQRAKKGVFITTSSFTREAEEYTKFIDNNIVLIDGEQLVNLMIDNDVGVTKVTSYDVKKVDLDYFLEE